MLGELKLFDVKDSYDARCGIVEKVRSEIGVISPVRKDGLFIVHDLEKCDGISVPRSSVLDYKIATVVGVGRCVRSISVGMRVLLGKFYGIKMPFGVDVGSPILLISEDQVDCIYCDD